MELCLCVATLAAVMTLWCLAVRLWWQVPALLRGGKVITLKIKVGVRRPEGQANLFWVVRLALKLSTESRITPLLRPVFFLLSPTFNHSQIFAWEGVSASLSPCESSFSPHSLRSPLWSLSSFATLSRASLEARGMVKALPGACVLPEHSQATNV